MDLTLAELTHVCGMKDIPRLSALLPFLNAAGVEAQITTPFRAAMWLGQLSHESIDFSAFEENLSYSTERLLAVWPHRFPTAEIASEYAHAPEALGNLVYADRLGNGDAASGDGFKYRGRGAIQLTGFDNYHRLAIETGVDFIEQPDLLAQPQYAFLGAARFWIWHSLNHFADAGDILGATRAINGGIVGLTDRQSRYQRALELLRTA